MRRSLRSQSPTRVVICGGGVAAVETLLALRAHLKVGVEVHLVAPNRRFVYQPLAVAAPFDLAETDLVDLAEIAADQHARLHVDSLARVNARHRSVTLASGVELPYDALVVAVGAEARSWLEGALHFGGSASVSAFRQLLEQLENGSERLVAFVSPPAISWTLPLYELALLTASHLADRGVIGAELTVVTSEDDPLAVFGPTATRVIRGLLADRGIALKAGIRAEQIKDGKLHLHPHAVLEVERVVALPKIHGPALPGLPSDAAGFVPVDQHSRVIGLKNVYAAGDATDSPFKQGGIAAQQADAAADAIAAQMGAPITPSPIRPTLRGMLLTGVTPTYLLTRIANGGDQSFQSATTPLWWPPSKIAARHLAPYLVGHSALDRDQTLQDRAPSSSDSATLHESHEEARELALAFAERDAADQHFQSALEWLEVIESLDGVLPPGYLHKRADWSDRAGR